MKAEKIKGIDLIDMGFTKDSDGYLIGNTFTYDVKKIPVNWNIKKIK